MLRQANLVAQNTGTGRASVELRLTCRGKSLASFMKDSNREFEQEELGRCQLEYGRAVSRTILL